MRKRWLAAAVLTVFVLSACGKETGENGGNAADGSALTGTETLEAGGMSGSESGGASGAEILSEGSGTSGAGNQSGSGNPVDSGGSVGGSFPEAAKPGLQEPDEKITAAQEGDAGTLQVTLPEGWTYDACPEDSAQLLVGDYGIRFYPEDAAEGYIELCYTDFFGVCGTGLEEKQVTLAGDEAFIGTYDNGDHWDFISFRGTNEGIVALTCEVDGWWPEYEEQVLEILETVCLIRDSMEESSASICGLPLFSQESSQAGSSADSYIEELGLSLEVTECTETGATLVFRQSGGNPTGELTFGDAYGIQRNENGEWADVPVAMAGNYAFHAIAYLIEPDQDREFQVDWEWLYGKLEPGEYRIWKEVDDFRKTGDYDVYEIYAYFEIFS